MVRAVPVIGNHQMLMVSIFHLPGQVESQVARVALLFPGVGLAMVEVVAVMVLSLLAAAVVVFPAAAVAATTSLEVAAVALRGPPHLRRWTSRRALPRCKPSWT